VAYSINGFGTTYYGMRDFERDGSYVTTRWFILGTLPIVPLGSIRIRDVRRGLVRREMYVDEDLGMDWLQVLMTYLYVYLCVPFAIYLIVMKEHSFVDDYRVPFWLVILFRTFPLLFVLAVPHLLRWYKKRSAMQRPRR